MRVNGVYQKAIRQSKPEMIAGLLSPDYVFNGHILSSDAAVKLVRAQMKKYGTRHYQMMTNKTDMNAETGRVTVLATERWGTGRNGGGEVIFSRRDVWTNTPAGWRLLASDIK